MYRKWIKRFMDILVSLAAMPFVGLSFLVCAPLIKLTDGGPVFYNAPRRGRNGKTFTMYKYRSMRVNSPVLKNKDGSTYSGANDPRVTKIGRIMRKLSVDELPQIINVLKGDMSFVGPRPTLAVTPYEQLDDLRRKRLTVLPGITGYSQAYFRNSIDQQEKVVNDCYYAEHISFAFDVKILLRTVTSVLGAKNIDYQESNVKKKEEAQG